MVHQLGRTEICTSFSPFFELSIQTKSTELPTHANRELSQMLISPNMIFRSKMLFILIS